MAAAVQQQQGRVSLKEQRYDRQLRLWGDHGQQALESAHVCVINATATGTEILKNLVLPGVGAFTIVDGNQVTGEDVGNSFFLQRSNIGQNRAQCATELLQELNNEVLGNFVEETPDKLLDNDPSFFCRFNVVIATQLPESTLIRLADVLWNYNIPLLVCRTYGLIGYMRIIIKEHLVVESHPDNALDDLRLDNPFPELREHVGSYDLDQMEKKDHSHIPWIVIVAKHLEKWCDANGGQIPKNYKEKEAFREMIRQGILKNENGVLEDEENFEEAIKSVNTSVVATKIPGCIEDIFSDDHCTNLSQQTPPFWIVARAVKEFVAKEGQGNLPLRGTIPDMIADSSKFIQLQNVYRDKAKKDIEAVGNYAAKLLQSLGKAPESISQKELKLFCRNSAFLRVVRCRSLSEEYGLNTSNKDEIISHMDNPDSEMVLYLMLRAVDRFFKYHGRYPGVYNYQVEDDIGKLKSCLNSFLQEYGLSVTVKDDYVHEFCRYGAAEPHTVAAFLGGAAAQEVVKIITKQFVIFNNTYLYNGMSQTSATFKLLKLEKEFNHNAKWKKIRRHNVMKTDLNLLLECLKYQMDHPPSQKEALITIYSVCQKNSDASDYFREIGGLMFVHNLAKSSPQSAVREASLFTLGGLAENNVFCQQILCTSGLFEDLRMFLINQDSSVNLKRVSVYVLLVLTSNNKSGQTFLRESGCLDVLLQLFRTALSVSEVSMLDHNMDQYHLWSSVCSALCSCVNNPQNEDNQNACSLVFPHTKYWLQSCVKPEIVRPICSFIGLTVANNSRIQHFFASIGGLAILDELLVKLIHNSSGNCSNPKLAVVVTKTLDACIADNSAIGVSLSTYNIVANLLMLLSYNILDSGEKFSVILTLGHCTDGCEENQYALVKNNGLPLMIQALTDSQDEELNKAATFVLQNCKAITEKLSLKLTEDSLNMDNVGQLEIDLQNREKIFEDYQDKAKQILCRIERLENEYQEEICSSVQTLESKGSHQKSYPVNKVLYCLQHEEQKQKRSTPEMCCNRSCEKSKNEQHKLHQDDKIRKQLCNVTPEKSQNNPRHLNEKVRRQIFIEDGIPKEEIIQMTSKHLQINASDQLSNKVETHTKMNRAALLNSASDELIPVRGLSKNELLKAAIGNAIDTSVSQSGHSNLPHSADNMKAVGINKVHKSTVCESSKSDVQASKVLFKRPDFVVGSMTQRVQNTEPIKLCSSTSNRGMRCIFPSSVDPKVSRCSGCVTVGLSLNSRNCSKILQSCKYLCEQHKVILEIETKYKRKLKRPVVSKDTSTDYNNADLQTIHDTCLKEHPIKQKNCFKDQDLSENHAYSLNEEEDAEIHSSNTSAVVFKKQQRRTRKDFTSEEISYLLDGVKKMGHHWNSILWAYPFQMGRTNVDLAKKYCKLQRNEKNKNI